MLIEYEKRIAGANGVAVGSSSFGRDTTSDRNPFRLVVKSFVDDSTT